MRYHDSAHHLFLLQENPTVGVNIKIKSSSSLFRLSEFREGWGGGVGSEDHQPFSRFFARAQFLLDWGGGGGVR